MKIGTCIVLEHIEEMEAKIAALKENNFDNCQLLCWEPVLFTDENSAILKELFEKYDVTISAFWCGWDGPKFWNFYEGPLTLGLVPPEYRPMRIQNLCDGADFALKLGVENIVTHMGYIPENPNDPAFGGMCMAVRQVAKHLKENGQYLLFETGQETPVTMLRCFEHVDMDNLGVNLDTANLILYGKANPVDSLDVFGQYVRNIHAKDGFYPTNGHSLGKSTKIGEGKVDFKALIRKLHEIGYDSYITIEREHVPEKQQQLEILEARTYLQNIIDEVCKTK